MWVAINHVGNDQLVCLGCVDKYHIEGEGAYQDASVEEGYQEYVRSGGKW